MEAMNTTEERKKNLKFRFEKKYLPDQLQTQIGFLENELSKTKKEAEIKISDLNNKIKIIEEKNVQYRFEIEHKNKKNQELELRITSLTSDLNNLNFEKESKIEENRNLNEQKNQLGEIIESKNVENNILKETLEACEANLERYGA